MAKKITRKELLKEEDEFLTLSGRAALFVSRHAKLFKTSGMVIAAVLLVYLGVTTYLGYVNRKGQEVYNKAFHMLTKAGNPGAEEQKEEKEAEALFQEVMADYGQSRVSRLAPAQLAFLKFREKAYDEAIPLYKAFAESIPGHSPYRSLARLGLAACYEAKEEFASAIEILQKLLGEGGSLFREQAMFSLARVYRLAKQEGKSREVLEKFLEEFESSPFVPIAKAHLSQLP